MTNRQLAAMETRRKLLEAGQKLIREKGLTNTSVAEITKACGVANGTFYTYFKRKEDILFEITRDAFTEILVEAQNREGTFEEKLNYYMVRFADYIEKSSLKMCQEWIRNVADPDLLDNPADRNKIYIDIDALKQLIRDGIAAGEVKESTDVDFYANTLNDVLYGEMLAWALCAGSFGYKERAEKFCSVFLHDMIKNILKGEE